MSRIFSTEGIIFKTIKYSESSIIADIYTREKGLKSFIISGVRSARSNSKAAIIRTCNFVQIIAYEQDAEKLSRIKEINLSLFYKNINMNVVVSSLAIFMLETSRNAIREKEPNNELYDFLKEWFMYLDEDKNYSNLIHIKFLLEFSYFLGFGPLQNYSAEFPFFDMLEGSFCNYYDEANVHLISEEISFSIAKLLITDKCALVDFTLSKDERNKLTDHLIHFYKLHMSGFRDINSLDILRSVL